MLKATDLRNKLKRINGKGYKAYKEIRGNYDFDDFILSIDHVQGDPFASPSRVRVTVAQTRAKLPKDSFCNRSREIALRDFLTREFFHRIGRVSSGKKGSGKSGLISIDRPGQEILERTSAFVDEERIEVRFFVGLPAYGRRIASEEAITMFFREIPEIVRNSLFYSNLDSKKLYRHIETAEDADFLRNSLINLKLIAFIGDGSILPRASGIDPKPLSTGRVIPFKSPETLKVSIGLPNRGLVDGMGIPEGVTLIVGGGYHGKSTLLNAIQLGIYNHIPGDGRELVVTRENAIKIRAEDGRRVEKVNISPFINNLPFGRNTDSFSTEDASGSTSQAANIIEATEAGCDAILMDEDTSATNFMIRDHRMQELISKENEPITPFIDKVDLLYKDYGISTILVMGGSGDYFDVADRVIGMHEYLPEDLTEKAKSIAGKYSSERKREGGNSFGMVTERAPVSSSFNPGKGKREVKISAKSIHTIMFGMNIIDLSSHEQLVDISQTRAVGDAIYYATKYMDGKRSIREVINMVTKEIKEKGLDIISPLPVGNYAIFRGIDLAFAINRLRTLKVRQV